MPRVFLRAAPRPPRPRVRTLLALFAGLTLAPPLAAQSAAPRSDVFVVATLYQRHDSTPAYEHATLRRVIERIRPEVVVLDVSPRELRDRAVHPSKQEYPVVIFPLLGEHGYRAYAGEPDEPEFSTVVQRLGGALREFRAAHPELAAADRAYEAATFQALARLWSSPADVNGAVTDQLLVARRAYQDRLAGPVVADAWARWNAHAVAVVRRAYEENPGKRILVLIGVEICAPLRRALRTQPELRLVDMEQWLRQQAGG